MLDCVGRHLSGAVHDDLGRRPISSHNQFGDREAISCHSYLLSDIAEVIARLSNSACHVNRAGLTRNRRYTPRSWAVSTVLAECRPMPGNSQNRLNRVRYLRPMPRVSLVLT